MSYYPTLADLTENLVSFTAHQVPSSLIWITANLDDGEVLRSACSYLIDPVSSATTKVFQAERYGGSGIQRNGGGLDVVLKAATKSRGSVLTLWLDKVRTGITRMALSAPARQFMKRYGAKCWHKHHLMVQFAHRPYYSLTSTSILNLSALEGAPVVRYWYVNQ